jgi:hypothetical protein
MGHPLEAHAQGTSCNPEVSGDGPLRIDDARVHVRDFKGPGGFVLAVGSNPLAGPFKIRCHNQGGCLLNVTAMVNTSGNTTTCTSVDGLFLRPPSPLANNSPMTSLQSGHLTTGQHTIDTIVDSGDGSETLGSWEVIYTLYDR